MIFAASCKTTNLFFLYTTHQSSGRLGGGAARYVCTTATEAQSVRVVAIVLHTAPIVAIRA